MTSTEPASSHLRLPPSPPGIDQAQPGKIILTGATVGTLSHHKTRQADRRASIPSSRLVIDELTYSNLDPLQPTQARLAWLKDSLTEGPRPQPFEQLANYYRRLGHDADARRVLHAKRKAQIKAATGFSSPLVKAGGAILNALTGYGYRPARALVWLIASLTIGYLVFADHGPAGISDPFNRALYTLDLIVPTSPFGLEAAVPPDSIAYWTANALKALGWILSLAILPAVTRGLSRD